ncbi:MAG TPA: hypothetical protein VGM39_20725, partial [Kofleriaceae bacterium]
TRLAEGKKDCLILDFVDVSELSLCTLPSLFGCPRDMDLYGGDASEAARTWEQIQLDYPELELEARALTLSEIQDRAAAFDPLTLEVNAEVRAISPSAWFSLGRHGVGLLFMKKSGQVGVVTVVNRGRSPRWVLTVGDEEVARYGTMEEAVQANDFEMGQAGAATFASAQEDAPWRRRPVPDAVRAQLRDPDRVHTLAEAMQMIVWTSVVGQRRPMPTG